MKIRFLLMMALLLGGLQMNAKQFTLNVGQFSKVRTCRLPILWG